MNSYVYEIMSRNKTQDDFTLKHSVDVKDGDVVFDVILKVNPNSRKGKKLLNDMLNKQSSAVKLILQKLEREHNKDVREQCAVEWYDLPDEIVEILNK